MAYSKRNRKHAAKHNGLCELSAHVAVITSYTPLPCARGSGAPRETYLFEWCRENIEVPSCQLHIRHLQTPTHKEIHDSCPRFFRYGDSMARTVKSSIYA